MKTSKAFEKLLFKITKILPLVPQLTRHQEKVDPKYWPNLDIL